MRRIVCLRPASAAALLILLLGFIPILADNDGGAGDRTAGNDSAIDGLGFEPGTVTEKVTCAGDPSQTYALYLPPDYDTQQLWPILFVLDPRGRALVALNRFKEGARDLRIPTLLKRAGNTSDETDALAAQRILETIYSYTSFYQPRVFFENKAPARALAILEIAGKIKPDNTYICWQMARAHGMLGHKKETLERLDCAEKAGWLRASTLRVEPAFDAVRQEKRFIDLVSRLEKTKGQ